MSLQNCNEGAESETGGLARGDELGRNSKDKLQEEDKASS